MEGITLSKAIEVFTRNIGCSDRSEMLDVIRGSMEFLLLNGGGNLLRSWKVIARGGYFTLPADLGSPVKYKLGLTANAGFGSFFSRYYAYSSQSVKEVSSFNRPFSPDISVMPNLVATMFQPPQCGARLCFTTKNPDDVGKSVIVSGMYNNMPIMGLHNGYKISGEILKVYLDSDPNKKYSAFHFDTITAISRDATCDYSMLSCITDNQEWYFLSHYQPDELVPRYKQCFMNMGSLGDIEIDILGKVAPNILYQRDEDVLPISSFEILTFLAKRARYEESGDYDKVAAMEGRIKNTIRLEVAYYQEPNTQMSYNLTSSGRSLTNI